MSKEPAKRELKQERAARTRVEILEAAITLFARRGFLATTMADLARAIHMTPGALYWHFPTKEDLLLAALDELHQRYLTAFEDVLATAPTDSARERLQAFRRHTHAFLKEHREYGIFFGMLTAEAADTHERVAEAIRDKLGHYTRLLEELILEGQRTGELRQDLDAARMAHAVFSAYLGMLMHQNLFRASLDYDPLSTALDALLEGGFLPRG
ncbi:TetR family transcriptional regulator [Myxococcus sp. K15C18031901]|uniref:TetR/AcrR family transcriptional regulator n=1 Tax=Myxococcus dinghuensis TaxID=2906761 RepID=UPI0020A8171B|nr:TetR/AcrR family transcriptional regulator [Myxococcus dinghuensis]MCP3103696.1 TetR family transcriptional regulator [Myxococcus dinghuensis]